MCPRGFHLPQVVEQLFVDTLVLSVELLGNQLTCDVLVQAILQLQKRESESKQRAQTVKVLTAVEA